MLQAVSEKGDYVILASLSFDQINQLKKNQSPFYCPVCKMPLSIKAGLQKTPHFAHQSLKNCPNRSYGEGIYHERGKLDLFDWLKNQGYTVKLEHYLPTIKQRADLFIQLKQKMIAIEYQCATIPLKEILERTKGYQSIGIIPIWILGGNRMRRLGKQGLFLTSTEQNYLLQYPTDPKPKMIYYCPDSRQFARFNLACFSGQSRSIGELQFLHATKTSFAHLFHTKASSIFSSQWLFEKRRFRLKIPKQTTKQEQRFREWLYLNQLFPSLLSSWVGLPVAGQWQMTFSVWTWQAYLYYDFLKNHPQFTLDQLMAFVIPFRKKNATLFPMLLKDDDPVLHYLRYLIVGKKLVYKESIFQVKGKLGQYQTVDEALENDQLLYSYLRTNELKPLRKQN